MDRRRFDYGLEPRAASEVKMKFAETLSAHITPEWRKQYIQYEEMKAMVYAAIEEAPAAEAADGEELQRYFASFDEKFFTFCDKGASTMNPRMSSVAKRVGLRFRKFCSFSF